MPDSPIYRPKSKKLILNEVEQFPCHPAALRGLPLWPAGPRKSQGRKEGTGSGSPPFLCGFGQLLSISVCWCPPPALGSVRAGARAKSWAGGKREARSDGAFLMVLGKLGAGWRGEPGWEAAGGSGPAFTPCLQWKHRLKKVSLFHCFCGGCCGEQGFLSLRPAFQGHTESSPALASNRKHCVFNLQVPARLCAYRPCSVSLQALLQPGIHEGPCSLAAPFPRFHILASPILEMWRN